MQILAVILSKVLKVLPLLLLSLTPEYFSVSLDDWSLLADSSVLVDPSLSTYDVIHVSRDVADDRDMTRDWCLHGNHMWGFLTTLWCTSLSDPDSALLPISLPGGGVLCSCVTQ